MAKKPPASSTKDLVEISEIRDSIVILKNGSLRALVEVSSTNFELKSTDEQHAIIQGFQDFLNSIDFPIQINVNSRKLNITGYLKQVEGTIETIESPLLKIQATEYVRFVKGLADLANIMTKKFYIVVPFYVIETNEGGGGGLLSKLKGTFFPSSVTKNLSDDALDKYRVQLEQRVSLVMAGVSRLSLSPRIPTHDELMNLFYVIYNPGQHL